MPHSHTLAWGAIAALIGTAAPAHAGIIMHTGSAQQVEPPASLHAGGWESNTRTRLFAEQTGVVLGESLNVDVTAPGTYDDFTDLDRSSLEAGTAVDSYLLHQDAVGTQNDIMLFGSITFDMPILALVLTTSRLNMSDALFGLAGVAYPTGAEPYRGLDLAIAADRISISEDRMTLTYRFETQTRLDQVRILTQSAVPAPGALAVLTLGAITGASRRRRS